MESRPLYHQSAPLEMRAMHTHMRFLRNRIDFRHKGQSRMSKQVRERRGFLARWATSDVRVQSTSLVHPTNEEDTTDMPTDSRRVRGEKRIHGHCRMRQRQGKVGAGMRSFCMVGYSVCAKNAKVARAVRIVKQGREGLPACVVNMGLPRAPDQHRRRQANVPNFRRYG